MSGLLHGFEVALAPENILLVLVGVILGTVVGLLPGLGPTAAIAILLPVTYTFDAAGAIILLAGIYYGSMFGGRIPAILLNVPGDAAAVVTAIEGYPLRKAGRAGEALGLTAIGSFLGGLVAIVGLAFFAPVVSSFALGLGSPEMFLLTAFGLLLIVFVSSGDTRFGLISATLGMLIALIGLDGVSGAPRFTLGQTDLLDGIGVVPLAVGLFGVSELLVDAERRYGSMAVGRLERIWPRARDIVAMRWSVARASVIGFIIGLVPGGGGAMSSVVAYGIEKKFSKNPEMYGKGAMDGLAATETADNASANSAFIPLLTLGIPPNAAIAMIGGALLLHGVTPGPDLIQSRPDVFYGVIASMFIGSVALIVLNLPLIGVFVQILKVPPSLMTVVILVLAVAGCYSVRNNIFDVYLMIGFAVFGYLLKKIRIPTAPLILGFILAPIMEIEFRRSMILSEGSIGVFVDRPMSIVLVALVATALFFLIFGSRIGGKRLKRAARVVQPDTV